MIRWKKTKILNIRIKMRKLLNKKKVFVATFLISYALAIIIGVGCAMFAPTIDINAGKYAYERINDLKLGEYLLFNVSAVIAPTTITFAGSILLLQNNRYGSVKSILLFIIMTAMVVLSIGLKIFDNYLAIKVSAWLIWILGFIGVLFSWLINEDPQTICVKHKNEISDGKMVT